MQRQRLLTSVVVGVVVGVDVTVLVGLRPSPRRLAADLGGPREWLARDGLDGTMATLVSVAIWLVAAWLGLAVLIATATRVPGSCGRMAAGACRIVLPAALRRIVIGGAGLGVLLSPVIADARPGTQASAHPTPPHAVTALLSAAPLPAALPAPTWPSDPPARQATPTRRPTMVAPPRWPASPARAAGPAAAKPADTPPTTGSRSRHPPLVARAARATVRPGDSLWLISARRLGSHPSQALIATSWPRWYAANRDVIGDDPSFITPGQVLTAPNPIAEEPAS